MFKSSRNQAHDKSLVKSRMPSFAQVVTRLLDIALSESLIAMLFWTFPRHPLSQQISACVEQLKERLEA